MNSSFNNSNWPYIIRAVRLWALILLVCFPLLGMLAASFLSGLLGSMVSDKPAGILECGKLLV